MTTPTKHIRSDISDDELSALVATVHGIAPVNLPFGAVKRGGRWFLHNGPYALECEKVYPPYSTSLDAVLPLVKADYFILTHNKATWMAQLLVGDFWFTYKDATPARAVCFALLVANGYEVEEVKS